MADRQGRRTVSRITFHLKDKQYSLTPQEAFSYAVTLMDAKHYRPAGKLLAAVEKVLPNNRQVRTMLARSEMGLEHERSCRLLLDTVFKGSDAPVAKELHKAFVYRKFGLLANAVAEVEKLLKKHGDLPTVYFVLGNLLLASDKREQAAECYRKAIEKDTQTGAVATAARKKLAGIEAEEAKIEAIRERRARLPQRSFSDR